MPEGIFYGMNMSSGMTVVLDPFLLENPNMVIVGMPGGGKSWFMKDLIEQYLLMGVRVYAIDIEDEYRRLCEDMGGVYLDMAMTAENKINVLDPDPEAPEGLSGAFQQFRGWMESVMLRKLDVQEIAVLDDAHRACFKAKGITDEEPDSLRKKDIPLLSDLHAWLKKQKGESAARMAAALQPMAVGSERRAFNEHTTVNIRSNPFVVFGLKGVDRVMLPRRIKQIQIFTWNQMLKGLRRTVEIVDEAWFLLEHESTAEDLAERARRFRKKNGMLVVASQQVADFDSNRHAKAVIAMASTHLIFQQKPMVMGTIKDLFSLVEQEVSEIGALDQGEYLLKTAKLSMHMFKPSLPERWPLYTTKPEEVQQLNEAEARSTERAAKQAASNQGLGKGDSEDADKTRPDRHCWRKNPRRGKAKTKLKQMSRWRSARMRT